MSGISIYLEGCSIGIKKSYWYQRSTLVYFPVENLPIGFSQPGMTTTANGKGLLMSYEHSVYSFSCKSEATCSWDTTTTNLKSSRRGHIMMRVPASMVNHCECQDGYYGPHTCESKFFGKSILSDVYWLMLFLN